MKLFSLASSSEYNNKLEKILENKTYNTQTKNLLLSMLYKIENATDDYGKVKRENSGEEFVNRILYIIENECDNIDIITPEKPEITSKEEDTKIDLAEGKITTYDNEKDLLYGIFMLDTMLNQYQSKKYDSSEKNIEEELMEESIKDFILQGISMDKSEIVRDFNGWAWDTNVNDIENINKNLLYQNLKMLLTPDIIRTYFDRFDKINEIDGIKANTTDLSDLNDKQIDKTKIENVSYRSLLKDAFEKMYTKERYKDILIQMQDAILINFIKENPQLISITKNVLKNKKEELDLISNKTKFLETVTTEKKILNKKIREIDQILSDKELLKDEYENRNKERKNENKIFSISHLAGILEEERKACLDKIKEDNKKLEPLNYVEEKSKLEQEYDKWKEIISGFDKNTFYSRLENIQQEFFKFIKVQIDEAETKTELINLMYRIRYYCLLPINEKTRIKDIKGLQAEIKDIINLLIDKCIDKKIIENVSNSISLCYTILNHIFVSNIIDLEKIYIKVIKEKEEVINPKEKEKAYYISINIYDEKEKAEEHKEIVDNLSLLNIKLNKKIQLFI